MSFDLPDPPKFGDPLPLTASPQTLQFLARRRSASAVTLCGEAPSEADVATLLRLATRVPDHGKLAPWRFIIMQGKAKAAMAERLDAIAANRPDAAKAHAALMKFITPPMAICVVSSPKEGSIPEWEQRLSAGAVCLTLLNAALAMGLGANWITDWYAYDEDARAALGLAGDEKVAGFIYLGTGAETPLERVRPDIEPLVTRL